MAPTGNGGVRRDGLRQLWMVVVVLVTLAATGCGSRVRDRAAVGGDTFGPTGTAPAAAAARYPSEATVVVSAPAATDAQPSSAAAGPRAWTASVNPPRSASSAEPAASTGAARPTPAHPREGVQPSGAADPVTGPGPVGARSAVVIASIGTFSGPIGAAFLPGLQTVQVWVADVNRRGGLGGHPVQLLVYDNGGDRARHRSQVQEAVERKRVLAIVYMAEAFVGHGAAPYLEAQRVPTIGGEGGGEWYDNPMYFPQASSGAAMYSIGVLSAAQVLLPEGKVLFGSLVCSEAANCDDAQRQWAQEAPRAGFRDVYRGKTSVAQPDYTAECLAARNAGAEVLLVVLDPSSVSRFALSCARQGYRPTLVEVSSIGVDRFKDDPNLDGLLLASNVFAYIQTGTRASDEYQRAMALYGANVTPGVSSALGWVAAKIFERAASALPEPPSREAVLQGLWSLRDDTLGGLTMPLTFVEGRPATPKSCWWNLRIKNRAWSSPDGFKANCR